MWPGLYNLKTDIFSHVILTVYYIGVIAHSKDGIEGGVVTEHHLVWLCIRREGRRDVVIGGWTC